MMGPSLKSLAVVVLFSAQTLLAAPYCPTAPANCNLNSINQSLDDLKQNRFMGALKSPDSVCKAALESAPKTDQVLQEMMLDPRFVNYVNPQLVQCWKQGSNSVSKVEALGRYAYIQKRLDDSAVPLADYLTFSDSILGTQPLSQIDNCSSMAPELAGLVRRCQDVKKQCQRTDASAVLATQFVEDYSAQGISAIEDRMENLETRISKCFSERVPGFVNKTTKWVASVFYTDKFNEKINKIEAQCKELVKERAAVALRLQLFYGSYPWAQQDTFKKIAGTRFKTDTNLAAKALRAQVQENAVNAKKQLDEIASASRCLLRGNCSTSKLNETLEKTNPLPDEFMFQKGQSKDQAKSRAAVTSFVTYNNCVDDMGQSQRKTSEVLWSSTIGAVGAVATLGGSLAVTGLTTSSRVLMGAASVGSRAANLGRAGIALGQAMDGVMTAESLYKASVVCRKNATATAAKVSKEDPAMACGLPSKGEFSFKSEMDDCILESVLGGVGLGAYGIGLKAQRAANKLAKAEQVTDKAASAKRAADQVLKAKAKATGAETAQASAKAAATETAQVAEKAVISEKASVAVKAEPAAKVTEAEVVAKDVASIESKATKISEPAASESVRSSQELAAVAQSGEYISLKVGSERIPAMILETKQISGSPAYKLLYPSSEAGKTQAVWLKESTLIAAQVRPSETAARVLTSINKNNDVASSAINLLRKQESPENIRKLVGKIDDTKDQGLARLRVATKVLGRELDPKEAYWILDAHKAAPIEEYGKIGAKSVRDKILAGEGRPKSMSTEETRKLFENGILGAPTGKAAKASVVSEAEDYLSLNLASARVPAKVLDVTEVGGVKLFKLQVKTAAGLEERTLSAGQLAAADVKAGFPAAQAFLGEGAATARRVISAEDKFVNLSLNYKTVPAQIKSSFKVKDGEKVYEVVHDTGDGLRSHFYSQYQMDIMSATKSERAKDIISRAISGQVDRAASKTAAVTEELRANLSKLNLKSKSPISFMTNDGKRVAAEIKDVHTAANGEKVFEVTLRTSAGTKVHFISETDLALREVKISETAARMFHEARVAASRPEAKQVVDKVAEAAAADAVAAEKGLALKQSELTKVAEEQATKTRIFYKEGTDDRAKQVHRFIRRMEGKENLRAQDLEMAATLSPAERIVSAKRILGRTGELTNREQDALLMAHSIGKGFGNYTKEEIILKTSLLKKGGFSDREAKLLLWKGLAGKMPEKSEAVIAAEAEVARIQALQAKQVRALETEADILDKAKAADALSVTDEAMKLRVEAMMKARKELRAGVGASFDGTPAAYRTRTGAANDMARVSSMVGAFSKDAADIANAKANIVEAFKASVEDLRRGYTYSGPSFGNDEKEILRNYIQYLASDKGGGRNKIATEFRIKTLQELLDNDLNAAKFPRVAKGESWALDLKAAEQKLEAAKAGVAEKAAADAKAAEKAAADAKAEAEAKRLKEAERVKAEQQAAKAQAEAEARALQQQKQAAREASAAGIKAQSYEDAKAVARRQEHAKDYHDWSGGRALTEEQSQYLNYGRKRLLESATGKMYEDMTKLGFTEREIIYLKMNHWEVGKNAKVKTLPEMHPEAAKVAEFYQKQVIGTAPLSLGATEAEAKKAALDIVKKYNSSVKTVDDAYEKLRTLVYSTQENQPKLSRKIYDKYNSETLSLKDAAEIDKTIAARKAAAEQCRNALLLMRALGRDPSYHFPNIEKRECSY